MRLLSLGDLNLFNKKIHRTNPLEKVTKGREKKQTIKSVCLYWIQLIYSRELNPIFVWEMNAHDSKAKEKEFLLNEKKGIEAFIESAK